MSLRVVLRGIQSGGPFLDSEHLHPPDHGTPKSTIRYPFFIFKPCRHGSVEQRLLAQGPIAHSIPFVGPHSPIRPRLAHDEDHPSPAIIPHDSLVEADLLSEPASVARLRSPAVWPQLLFTSTG
jgi:hypothetical protein